MNGADISHTIILQVFSPFLTLILVCRCHHVRASTKKGKEKKKHFIIMNQYFSTFGIM